MIKKDTLTEIIDKDTKFVNDLVVGDINKYVIELIRISKMYKFQIKVKRKNKIKEDKIISKENIADIQKNIDEQIKETKEDPEEINQYITIKEEINEDNISYADDLIKIKDIEYKVEKNNDFHKINTLYQELWEKEGFYQERPGQLRVKVQIWPEHLPYDHFKRKRAFLFC